MRLGLATIGRWVAALLVLGEGAIHLKLYFDGYRDLSLEPAAFFVGSVHGHRLEGEEDENATRRRRERRGQPDPL